MRKIFLSTVIALGVYMGCILSSYVWITISYNSFLCDGIYLDMIAPVISGATGLGCYSMLVVRSNGKSILFFWLTLLSGIFLSALVIRVLWPLVQITPYRMRFFLSIGAGAASLLLLVNSIPFYLWVRLSNAHKTGSASFCLFSVLLVVMLLWILSLVYPFILIPLLRPLVYMPPGEIPSIVRDYLFSPIRALEGIVLSMFGIIYINSLALRRYKGGKGCQVL